ncbi:bifunctional MaoC family dehydratase N-terminal/OB-fold nucleic acid binding domain-containing protein [Streptomyces sp. Root369]|uniref:bifunctional MaoC family dehydratase N-terminal/OB-fold nucleic acid binding domain-containing protein n=1 Tax=Streptomyces sp. Root369 TaxID=1736523 RepID=UPI000AF70530|nr:bifunctional MaoC family dehydratase N-terminal/OB-fold nucleic acid binding domain-containing protein [Streptomyces sp. Root369]
MGDDPDTPPPRPEVYDPDDSAARPKPHGANDSTAPGARDPDAVAARPQPGDTGGPAVRPLAGDTDHQTPRPHAHRPTDNLLTRLKAYEGHPAAVAGVGKDPVNLPMIRHWCEALGDANPVYTGPGAVAPPTMLQAWTMGGLTGHMGRSSAYDELLALLDESGCTSVVATDCEQEYFQPLRPGDRITFDTVIESVSDRKTTKLGTGHFVTTRTDVRVGETLVGTHRFRILKYAPSQRKKPPPRPQRPRPVVNRDNAGFWEGVEQHRLLLQRCTSCATLRFPWLPGCAHCGGPDWDTVEASGEGTVHSYVVMHHPPFPAFDPPYAVVLVELAEGVRMISNVVGTPYDKVRIGMPVRLVFRTYDGDLTLPVFRAAAEEAAAEEAAV